MEPINRIFVIGGTGAQGLPVVNELSKAYHVRVLTRDTSSQRAQELAALPNVELLTGSFDDQALLLEGFKDCQGAFINIDGFSLGQKNELFWGIRTYELARQAGVKFLVWANLDYGYKKSGYDPKHRCGHYDAKGIVGEWILTQPNHKMGAALFTTGPYLDMTLALRTPMEPKVIDGVVTWAVPLGSGAVPHIALSDCGQYVRWLFENRAEANGMDLEVATEHVHYADLAAAYTRVTGRPARYVDVPADEYFSSGYLGSSGKVGRIFAGAAADQDKSFMSWRENFEGFWNNWKYSGGNTGVVIRDYTMLDRILPGRIRTAEEWFRKQQEAGVDLWAMVQEGNIKPVIKLGEDAMKAAHEVKRAESNL